MANLSLRAMLKMVRDDYLLPLLGQRDDYHRVGLFMIWSIHLTIMSGFGLVIWTSPQRFIAMRLETQSGSTCALEFAKMTILKWSVPFGSNGLRTASLAIYGTFVFPGINLIVPAAFALALSWVCSKKCVGMVANACMTPQAAESLLQRLSKSLPTCIGLVLVLAFDVVFIVNLELTLKRNRVLQDSGDEAQWGFGQILAMVLLFQQVRGILGKLLADSKERERRHKDEAQTQFRDDALREAVREKDLENVRRWVLAGADPNAWVEGDDGEPISLALEYRVRVSSLALRQIPEKVHCYVQHVEVVHRDRRTAIDIASEHERDREESELIQLLLQHGAVKRQ
ncbi:hypothetical protein NMY22_g11577 [Coprinellus aureogranulatus]|nr:hypothetical protein NMY22_g11577 [Coprinellus aureogranulatus]